MQHSCNIQPIVWKNRKLQNCGLQCDAFCMCIYIYIYIYIYIILYICICFLCTYLFICLTRPVIWRFRLIVYITHALSFGVSCSSYIFNMPPHPHLASQVCHIGFTIYPKHDPSFGLPFAPYILNSPTHLAIPNHPIC